KRASARAAWRLYSESSCSGRGNPPLARSALCIMPARVRSGRRRTRMATVFKPMMTGLAAALVAWSGAALAAQDGDRITSFILSSGGLAQIERHVRVTDRSSVKLPVPLEQVDDVLKSLVVHDPGGQATSIVLDGEAPVQEAFSRLPFGPEALSSPA